MGQDRFESAAYSSLAKVTLFLAGLGVCMTVLASACATGTSDRGGGSDDCNEDDVCDDEEDCECSDCADTSACDGTARRRPPAGRHGGHAPTSGATTR